jgi:uncharacterized protein (TIGR01777 family)
MSEKFEASVELPASAEEVFAWHTRPGALQRLSPPWESLTVFSSDGVRDGGRTVLEVQIGPVHERWVAVHRDVTAGRGFVDEQLEGPFRSWIHTHRIEPLGPDRARLTDSIEYALPFGALGRLFGGGAVQRRLERSVAYRHAILADDLRRHAEQGGRRLRVAVSGASGLIGGVLVPMLTSLGHEVRSLVRRAPQPGEIAWDPERGVIDADQLAGLDAVVHLAAENIGEGRWSEAKKQAIRDSRVRGTALIAEALARLRGGPRTLVSMSAIGWYGDRREPVDESSARGEGFLSEVCEAWERAADPARAAGLRVVHPRGGVALTPAGGPLPRMLGAFKMGAGGRIGRGDQGLSWVAIDDLVAGLHAALLRDDLAGPVNVCSPEPVDSATFTRVLGQVLRRPTFLPLPEAAVRLAFGEMGEALLLEGAFVRPARLQAVGHRFGYPALEAALRHLLP